jgi:hypothetical protein
VSPIPILECYPYLDQLLGAYLNSDYTIHGPDLADAVAAYAADEGWLDVVAARADIRRFVGFYGNDVAGELNRRFADHAQDPDQSAADFLRWLDTELAGHQAAGAV